VARLHKNICFGLYFSSVHSIISYGIIFCGNCTYSNTIFKLLKRVIRIMVNVGNREPCRELFKKLNILTLHFQFILSLLLFVVKNINMFKSNSVVHSVNTRHFSDLYLPSVHLSKVHSVNTRHFSDLYLPSVHV